MTVGAGIYISQEEQNQLVQNHVIRQLIEGRSNAVGSCSLTASATATTVIAPTCGANSAVFLFPTSSTAASATPYVSSVVAGSFIVAHDNSASSNRSFVYVCLG